MKMASRGSSSFRVSSSYHEKCVSESVKRIEAVTSASATSGNYSTGVHRNCNQVAQGDVWKELVRKEKHCKKAWSVHETHKHRALSRGEGGGGCIVIIPQPVVSTMGWWCSK